ncbi:MAG: M20 family metallopeptidase [Actinomycetota bacterium]|nr:M20 family metallopeptidase [Actinomycetota bacterium]MDA3000082.1 M20 family metallopeptidase [Actinomycetota bacterium]
MTTSREAKDRVTADVSARADRLVSVSHEIHAHPELNYEEVFAHDLLCSVLEDCGFPVVRHAYGVDTAFEVSVGSSGPEILVLLEYDALPGIGHGCGHNVIAAAGLGAGLAAASLADELGGRLRILGTPAEEGGGGKIALARQGAFDSGTAAMMIHPADADLLRMDSLAIHTVDVVYHGREAHASAAPWMGRNALDAAVLGYMNVAALRQHIRPEERVHGIFTEAGEKPNIVPRRAAATWYVRSPTISSLQPLKDRVMACLEGAASACGCQMDSTWDGHTYAEVRDNERLASAYAANMAEVGRAVVDPRVTGRAVLGSTDMGNVSYLVPSIHPMVQVAPSGIPIHTREFAEHAGSDGGDKAVIDGARAMAMTVVDLWLDEALRERVASEFASLPRDIDVLA